LSDQLMVSWVFLSNEIDKKGGFRLTIDTPVLLRADSSGTLG